jgi:hypothetical protein
LANGALIFVVRDFIARWEFTEGKRVEWGRVQIEAILVIINNGTGLKIRPYSRYVPSLSVFEIVNTAAEASIETAILLLYVHSPLQGIGRKILDKMLNFIKI